MSREIPEPVRAAAGLAATVLDEVRKLPETLPGLPVRAIGLAMQAALKFQQEYAGLVARGDELLTGIRGESEPGLATFDDDEPAPSTGFHDSAFDRVADDAVAPLLAVAEEAGRSPAQVALRWLLQRPGVTAPIVGARRMEQLEDNLGAAGWELDQDQINKLSGASALENVYPYRFIERAQRV